MVKVVEVGHMIQRVTLDPGEKIEGIRLLPPGCTGFTVRGRAKVTPHNRFWYYGDIHSVSKGKGKNEPDAPAA